MALLVLGCGMRLAFPSRMAVEHFDEGVYASNIWFGPELGYQYPMRHLYAPPLLPTLVEWSIIAEQMSKTTRTPPSSWAVMAPSLLAGCLTLAAAWWMAREWFGRDAGVATLALASLSDFHALYSRAVLTDVLLCFFLLAALWAWRRALARTSYQWAALTGVLTGLAWWTKYNGWLPLAIGLGGLGLSVLGEPAQRPRAAKLLGLWIIAAAASFVLWSPFLWQLQSLGGYSSVAANHRQYVVGVAGWWSSLDRQYANLRFFDGAPSCLALGLALLLAAWLRSAKSRSLPQVAPWRCATVAVLLSAAAMWLGTCAVMFAMGAAYFVVCARGWTARATSETAPAPFASSLLFVWVVGLFLLTPLYHPYPRLTLPWLGGLWLSAGAGIVTLLRSPIFRIQSPSAKSAVLNAAVAAAGLALLLVGWSRQPDRLFPAWQARAGWLPVARKILHRAEQGRGDQDAAILFVYGEPGLFYHLNSLGSQLVIATANLNFPETTESTPIFLVAGPHAQRTPAFAEEFARHRARLELVASLPFSPSDLVLLDQHHPRALPADREQEVLLYAVK